MTDDLAGIEARAEALVESDLQLLEKLIALRIKHRLSQAVVATRMGVTQPTVSSFEKYDANPRLSTIRRYALAVDGLITHEVEDDCARRGVWFNSEVKTFFTTQWEKPVTTFGGWLAVMRSDREADPAHRLV
jgi:transcriptional regulator with XRE-family HTH domain